MVDFGSGQGYSVFATAGAPQEMPLGCIRAIPRIAKKRKTQPWAKRCSLWMDTIYELYNYGIELVQKKER